MGSPHEQRSNGGRPSTSARPSPTMEYRLRTWTTSPYNGGESNQVETERPSDTRGTPVSGFLQTRGQGTTSSSTPVIFFFFFFQTTRPSRSKGPCYHPLLRMTSRGYSETQVPERVDKPVDSMVRSTPGDSSLFLGPRVIDLESFPTSPVLSELSLMDVKGVSYSMPGRTPRVVQDLY